jgi:phenylacetic acid degradation operon negative regulatory protein
MNTTSEHLVAACLRQARPRLNTLLKLMFGEAHTLGHPTQWQSSVIELMQSLNFGERAIRTALFRLGEHRELDIERHGRRSLCMLAPAAAATMQAMRQRLNRPPARSFGEDWTMLVNSGGLGAARYAEARKRLQRLDYCQLAPNVMARPAAYGGAGTAAMPPGEEHGLALFDVSGAQLAAAVRQPLFGQPDRDLATAAAQYRQFLQRFQPLRQQLGQRGAISDEQAYRVRLLVTHGYLHCRGSDPLLPQELLPEAWPAMAAHQTYMALYGGCAGPARRHMLKVMAAPPDLAAVPAARPAPADYMTA